MKRGKSLSAKARSVLWVSRVPSRMTFGVSFGPTGQRGIVMDRRPSRVSADHHAGLLGAEAVIARLDDLVDEPEPLVERGEGALERVERQPLHLAEADRERLVERRELARQRDAAHQPVVGVEGDPEAEASKEVDRVLGD